MPPATSRTRRLVVDVAVAVLVGWLLLVAAQWTSWLDRTGAPMDGPRGERGRFGPQDWDTAALNLTAVPFVMVIMVGLAVRRLSPRVGFVAVCVGGIGYVLTGGPFPPALFAVVLCVYVLAATQPLRGWLPLGVLVLIMVLGSGWGSPYLGLLELATYANLIFAVALGGAAALLAIVRVGRHDAVRQRRADELDRVAAQERLRLAREVHDVVGHSLSVISMQAGVALHVLDRRPDQIRPALEAIRTTSSEAMAELRHALGVFRDSDGSPTTPAPDLARVDALVTALRSAGRDVTVERDLPTDFEASAALQQTAFRIIQESLTNVVRHADHARAGVRIGMVADGLEIEVTDDGPLLSGPPVEGNGLRGMRERVTAAGGRLDVGAQPTGGLRVHAVLPWESRVLADPLAGQQVLS